MIDFRGQSIGVGDVVIYVGRQDLKPTLIEGRVIRVTNFGDRRKPLPAYVKDHITVKPTRSSNPLGQPTGKLVTLTVARKKAGQ